TWRSVSIGWNRCCASSTPQRQLAGDDHRPPHAAKRRAGRNRAHSGPQARRGRPAGPAACGRSWVARCVVENPKGGGRTPLHLFADWPGHRPNAAAIVQTLAAAGADLDAPAVGMWHRETPLHWAASNDDVALIDALLDAGADIEHE